MDTHAYDGVIRYAELAARDDAELNPPPSWDETIQALVEAARGHPLEVPCLETLRLLLHDTDNNHDPLNGVRVEDLLPRTWRFVRHYEDLDAFLEQLADVSVSGPCAQGRVVRLFQFYEFHMSVRDELYERERVRSA